MSLWEFSGLSALENKLLGKYVGGTDLSGGQWQKLAIARAAYRNRDLIVLDEPTSNLDPLAETEIFEKYNSLERIKPSSTSPIGSPSPSLQTGSSSSKTGR